MAKGKLTGEGDVGGQKTLRSYWRNYFEKTDALVWVVDATDRGRVADCKEELAGLLLEEVRSHPLRCPSSSFPLGVCLARGSYFTSCRPSCTL